MVGKGLLRVVDSDPAPDPHSPISARRLDLSLIIYSCFSGGLALLVARGAIWLTGVEADWARAVVAVVVAAAMSVLAGLMADAVIGWARLRVARRGWEPRSTRR